MTLGDRRNTGHLDGISHTSEEAAIYGCQNKGDAKLHTNVETLPPKALVRAFQRGYY